MRLGKLDLNLLVSLDALLSERSVTRAAQRLNLSPSATSNALARLRDYFKDDLLVQMGRKMILTPRAERLRAPIHDILLRVEATVVESTEFDPQSSERSFRIIATDYMQMALMPHLMSLIYEAASPVQINLLPWTSRSRKDLERGEADFLIATGELLSSEHPLERLYEERLVCLMWEGAYLAQGAMTAEWFMRARHVKVNAWSGVEDPSISWYPQIEGYVEKVAATTYSLTAVPGLIEGTGYIAVVPYLLAKRFAETGGLKIAELPFGTPELELAVQWNNYSGMDPGIQWLRGLLKVAAGLVRAGC